MTEKKRQSPSPDGTPTSTTPTSAIQPSPTGTPTSLMGDTVSSVSPREVDIAKLRRRHAKALARERRIARKKRTAQQAKLARKTAVEKPVKVSARTAPIKRRGERVAISVLTLKRPAYLSQCLDSILLNDVPLKIVITNQADYSEEQIKVVSRWANLPYVHYRVNDPPKWPGASRAEVFRMAKKSGYEYIITLDDDCKLLPNAVDELVKAADKHPEFYAISGFLKTPHRGKYMLGGTITIDGGRHLYRNYGFKPGVREADFICNGFRLIRLEPLVVPDGTYTIGLTDFDWALEAKSRGLRLAVCGEAGAFHKFMFIDGKRQSALNPIEYHNIRRNRTEIVNMRRKFEAKWGFKIK